MAVKSVFLFRTRLLYVPGLVLDSPRFDSGAKTRSAFIPTDAARHRRRGGVWTDLRGGAARLGIWGTHDAPGRGFSACIWSWCRMCVRVNRFFFLPRNVEIILVEAESTQTWDELNPLQKQHKIQHSMLVYNVDFVFSIFFMNQSLSQSNCVFKCQISGEGFKISQGLIIYLFFYEGSNVHLNHFTTIHQVMSQLFFLRCPIMHKDQ